MAKNLRSVDTVLSSCSSGLKERVYDSTLVARHYDDFKEDTRLDWDAINNNPSQTLFVYSFSPDSTRRLTRDTDMNSMGSSLEFSVDLSVAFSLLVNSH